MESLAAVLREHQISVKLIDAHADNVKVEDIINEVLNNEYKVVGFSLFQFSVNLLGHICSEIKKVKRDIHITCGGHFVTGSYRPVLERFNALDSVILGEGEYALYELASKVISGQDWSQVLGLAYHKAGEVCLSQPRELIDDLDSIPYPSRDFLDKKIAAGKQISTINIYSSRGCYGTCKFCSIKAFYNKKGLSWRARTAKNVVDELECLNNKYKPKRFMFVDDNFIGIGKRGKLRTIEIAQELIKRNLKISFMISCRVDDVEPVLFKLLIKAGLVEVFLGIESFSIEELKFFNKQINYEENFKTIEYLQRMRIGISAGFIMFTPYTQLGDIKRNIKYLEKYGLLDEGKFTFINRIVGSAFDLDKTPGMLDDHFNVFDYPLNGKMGYHIFNDKTLRLANIIRNQNLTLRGFNILRKCKMVLAYAEQLPDYFLYSNYLNFISHNNVKLNVNYIKNIISIINRMECESIDYELENERIIWENSYRLVNKFLMKVKKFLLKGERSFWRFHLNSNVIISDKAENGIKYINTVSNSYVIVNERVHKLIQLLCSLDNMTYEDILNRLRVSNIEFEELVRCFFDRIILEYENTYISFWEKIPPWFYLKKQKVVCWNIKNEPIDRSAIGKIESTIIKKGYSGLKISTDNVDSTVLDIIQDSSKAIQYIGIQTKLENYTRLEKHIDYIDQFIFVVSKADFEERIGYIVDLHKTLSFRMPKPPMFAIKNIEKEFLYNLNTMDIPIEVQIFVDEVEDDSGLITNNKELDMDINSNISLIFDDLESVYYCNHGIKRKKTFIDYAKDIYIYD